MISWTIPTAKSTTGATTFTSSASSSNSFSGTNTTGFSYSGSGFTSSSSTISRSTSFGLSATTYYTSSSSASASALNTDTFQTQASGSTSNVVSAATASVQTSTTITQAFDVYSLASSEDTTLVWTSSFDSTASSVEFYETETTAASWYEEVVSQGTATVEAVTNLTATQTYGEQATVVQANTLLASNADIIYVLDPPTSWIGYSAATESATSGTRFTIAPSYITSETPPVAATVSPTSSTANPLVSGTISWQASTTAQTTITTAFPNFTGPGVTQLPVSTQSVTTSKVTTTNSTAAFTVFSAQTVTFNISTADRTRVTTSTTVENWGASLTTAQRQFAEQTFQTTVSTTARATRTSTTAVPASASSSASNVTNNTGSDFSEQTITQSRSGVTASANSYVYGNPQATVSQLGGFSRSKFVTTGAEIGSSRGGWFTAADSFFLPVAHGGGGRRGVTIFPTSYTGVTAYSNSVTYSKTVGTDTTTSSTTVGLSGDFLTTTQNTNQSFGGNVARSNIAGAGILPEGMTIIDVAGLGVYKDGIAGQTTSFSGAATAITQGQSGPIKCWQPIRAVAPPAVRLERNFVYWATPRNGIEQPPA